MWAVSPIPCFIGSVASIGGGSIPLQGSMVRACLFELQPLHIPRFFEGVITLNV